MARSRRTFSNEFKSKVALAAVGGGQSVNELASRFGVHPTQVNQWKRELLQGAAGVFGDAGGGSDAGREKLEHELYEKIGRLEMDLSWLKKK